MGIIQKNLVFGEKLECLDTKDYFIAAPKTLNASTSEENPNIFVSKSTTLWNVDSKKTMRRCSSRRSIFDNFNIFTKYTRFLRGHIKVL